MIHNIHVTQTVGLRSEHEVSDNNLKVSHDLNLTQTIQISDYMYSFGSFCLPPTVAKKLGVGKEYESISFNEDYSSELTYTEVTNILFDNNNGVLRTPPIDIYETLLNWLDEISTLMGWETLPFYRIETDNSHSNITPKHYIKENFNSNLANRTPITEFELYGYDWCYYDYLKQVRDRLYFIFSNYMNLNEIETNPLFTNIADLVRCIPAITFTLQLYNGREIIRYIEKELYTDYKYPLSKLQPPNDELDTFGTSGQWLSQEFITLLPAPMREFNNLTPPRFAGLSQNNKVRFLGLRRNRYAEKIYRPSMSYTENPTPTQIYSYFYTPFTFSSDTCGTPTEYRFIKMPAGSPPDEMDIYLTECPRLGFFGGGIAVADYSAKLAQSSWSNTYTLEAHVAALEEIGISFSESFVDPNNSNTMILKDVTGYNPTTETIYIIEKVESLYCSGSPPIIPAGGTCLTIDPEQYTVNYTSTGLTLFFGTNYDMNYKEVFEKANEALPLYSFFPSSVGRTNLNYYQSQSNLNVEARTSLLFNDFNLKYREPKISGTDHGYGIECRLTDLTAYLINIENATMKNRFGMRVSDEVNSLIYRMRIPVDEFVWVPYNLAGVKSEIKKKIFELCGMPYTGVKLYAKGLPLSGFSEGTSLTDIEYGSVYDPVDDDWDSIDTHANVNTRIKTILDLCESETDSIEIITCDFELQDLSTNKYLFEGLEIDNQVFHDICDLSAGLIAIICKPILNESWDPPNIHELLYQIYKEFGTAFLYDEGSDVLASTDLYGMNYFYSRNMYYNIASPNHGGGITRSQDIRAYYNRATFEFSEAFTIILKAPCYSPTINL